MTERSGRVTIADENDILRARLQARNVAQDVGFGTTDVTRIVTAVSELARNVYLYADGGTMSWEHRAGADPAGLEFVFDDDGPGIEDPEAVIDGGVTDSAGMGRGISGTNTLMDAMDIESERGEGTTITIVKHLT